MTAPTLPPPRLALCDRCDYIADDGTVRQDGYTIDQMRAAVLAEREACAKVARDFVWFDHECCAPDDAHAFIARMIEDRAKP